jgi:copper chaperone CopZ
MEMKTTRLKVSGMTCGHCASAVEKALKTRPGVRSATVHLDENAAEVEYAPSEVSPEQLVSAVQGAGYQADVAGDVGGGD